MNVRPLVIGLVIGLVFGAGIASLVWVLTTDSGNDDVAAVCGVVERTPVPNQDTPIEELRRWGVGEVMPSVAKANPEYKPLADAMEKAVHAMQSLDFDAMKDAVDQAKSLCADV
jgi:hypothetical protein